MTRITMTRLTHADGIFTRYLSLKSTILWGSLIDHDDIFFDRFSFFFLLFSYFNFESVTWWKNGFISNDPSYINAKTMSNGPGWNWKNFPTPSTNGQQHNNLSFIIHNSNAKRFLLLIKSIFPFQFCCIAKDPNSICLIYLNVT